MIFLESSDFYLRVVVFDFINTKQYPNLTFRLIPTVHVGTEEFYSAVIEEINSCDELLMEGIEMEPPKEYTSNEEQEDYEEEEYQDPASELGSYHHLAAKLGLTTEHKMVRLELLTPKLLHADMNYEQSSKAVSKLRFTEKIKFNLFPLLLRTVTLFTNRQKIAKSFRKSVELSARKLNPWTDDEEGSLGNFFLNSRDKIVIKILKKKLKDNPEQKLTVGILYGAAHMTQISRFLIDKKGFVALNGRYLKVFDVV